MTTTLNSSSKATSENPWLEQPSGPGPWLVRNGETIYEADVREICAGVFEVLIHGYCLGYHPICCLPGLDWAWAFDKVRGTSFQKEGKTP